MRPHGEHAATQRRKRRWSTRKRGGREKRERRERRKHLLLLTRHLPHITDLSTMQQEIKHLLNSYKVIDAASDYITVVRRDLEKIAA